MAPEDYPLTEGLLGLSSSSTDILGLSLRRQVAIGVPAA